MSPPSGASLSSILSLALLSACARESTEGTDTSVTLVDEDGDGWPTPIDCDDSTDSVSPGAPERCNRVDDDCDGLLDDHPTDGYTSWLDYDGDGYGDSATRDTWCGARDLDARPWVFVDGDCDDGAATVNPSAAESCASPEDDDCDGSTNDDNAVGCEPWYQDLDGDGVGIEASACLCETAASWRATSAGDCDDTDPAVTTGCTGTGAWTLDDADSWIIGDPEAALAGYVVAAPGDLDEDGVSDLLLASPDGRPTAWGVRGPIGPREDLAAPDVVFASQHLVNPTSIQVGGGLDLDGDGSPDFALATYGYLSPRYQGFVEILPGDSTGAVFSTVATVTVEQTTTGYHLGMSPVPDATGDSLPDLVLAGPEGVLAEVLAGPLRGEVDSAEAVARITDPSLLSTGLGAAADLDGDGVNDLVTAGTRSGNTSSAVMVFYGPISGTLTGSDADAELTSTTEGVIYSVGTLGDLDGDGAEDLGLGGFQAPEGSYRSEVRIFDGPFAGTEDLEAPDATMLGGGIDEVGWILAGRLDLDGDGRNDVAVGASGDDTIATDAGAARVWYGPVGGTFASWEADLRIYGTSRGDLAGTSLAAVPDLDGDGCDELLVGAPSNSGGGVLAGGAWLFYGAAR